MLLNIFILCSISQFSFGFYQSIDQASDLKENSTLIRNFAIKYDQNQKNLSDTGFPLKFSINIKLTHLTIHDIRYVKYHIGKY